MSAHAAWLHGLKIVAVAVVAQAVWGMGRTLCPDRLRASMAVAAAVAALAAPSAIGQVGAIAAGAVIGWLALPAPAAVSGGSLHFGVRRPLAVAALVAFFLLLAGLPVLAAASGNHAVALFDRFYRAGALVFGGGHVVLPLLQQAVVPPGWIGAGRFPGRLWRGPGGAGAAVHLRRLSRRRRWVRRRRAWPGGAVPAGDLPAVGPAVGGRAAVLGRAAPAGGGTVSAARSQRGRGRGAAGGALHARSGPRRSKGRPISASGWRRFLLWYSGKLPPWLVVVLGGAVAAALG